MDERRRLNYASQSCRVRFLTKPLFSKHFLSSLAACALEIWPWNEYSLERIFPGVPHQAMDTSPGWTPIQEESGRFAIS